MEFTALDLGLHFFHLLHDIGRNLIGANSFKRHCAVFVVHPNRCRIPLAVDHLLDLLGVVRSPIQHKSSNLGIRSNRLHVAVVRNNHFSCSFSSTRYSTGIGVLSENVRPLTQQSLGRVGVFGRIVPSVGPNHLYLNIRINGFGTQCKGVDTLQNFRNRERSDITDDVALSCTAGKHTGQIAAFVEANVVIRHVGRSLVTGGMLEFHIRVFFSKLLHVVHVAEAGSENQLVAVGNHLTNNSFCVSSFRNILHECRRDFIFTYLINSVDTADVMLFCIANVRNRSHIHKTDFQGFSCLGLSGRSCRCCRFSRGSFFFVSAGAQSKSGSNSSRSCNQF